MGWIDWLGKIVDRAVTGRTEPVVAQKQPIAHGGKVCRECFTSQGYIWCPEAPHPWHDKCGQYGPGIHSAAICKPVKAEMKGRR